MPNCMKKITFLKFFENFDVLAGLTPDLYLRKGSKNFFTQIWLAIPLFILEFNKDQ